MSKLLRFTLAFCVLLIPFGAMGQSSTSSTPPPAIRLGAAPERQSWTIRYAYTQANQFPAPANEKQAAAFKKLREAHPRITEVQVVKAARQRQETHIYENGDRAQSWVDGDMIVTRARGYDSLFAYLASDPESPQFTGDFNDLAWVVDAAYLGRDSLNGERCHVYASGEGAAVQRAFISETSGLPLRVQTPEAVATYEYSSSAPGIQIPPEVTARMREKRRLAAAVQPPEPQ